MTVDQLIAALQNLSALGLGAAVIRALPYCGAVTCGDCKPVVRVVRAESNQAADTWTPEDGFEIST